MATINGTAPTVNRARGATPPENYGRYVRRSFSHALRGYSTAEVDAHLRQVAGWFTLAGFDRFLDERREELLGPALAEAASATESARQESELTRQRAQREAQAILQVARREAEETLERARRESQAIVAEATRRAEASAAAAERRLAALKKLASEILDEGLESAA